jgi:heme A synthase
MGRKIVSTRSQKRLRVSFAWTCLLAAVLLFAPLAGAAWSAHAAACCTGDHCPIPEHHHRSKAARQDSNCEHQAGGMMACSMNCCQTVEHPLLASLAFVLPAGALLAGPGGLDLVAQDLQAKEFPRFPEVISPPPRSGTTL